VNLGQLDVIEYRHYRNSDPPRILTLWNQSGFARGGATGISHDLLDQLLFSQPYFDRRGLILACEDDRLVGMVHAGFGCNEHRTDLNPLDGVICQLLVHPERRRQGIGRELMDRAKRYLVEQGSTTIHAGPGPGRDPFYCGLYGGSESAGFLATDEDAAEFLASCGFEAADRFVVYQRPLELEAGEAVDFRSVQWKRQVRIEISAQNNDGDWWWNNRFGRLDYVRFRLLQKENDEVLASLTLIGLDQFIPKWNSRAIGLADIHVAENRRRQGLGRLLITETLRRLKQETISLVESHAIESDVALMGLLTSCGFQRIDAGTQYRSIA
jgi:ribosomal protein S18 acetylase RimI-like enzyme